MSVCLMCKGQPDDVDGAATEYVCSHCAANLLRMDEVQLKCLYEKCLAQGWTEKAEYLVENFDVEEGGGNVRQTVTRCNTGGRVVRNPGDLKEDDSVPKTTKRTSGRVGGKREICLRRTAGPRVVDSAIKKAITEAPF